METHAKPLHCQLFDQQTGRACHIDRRLSAERANSLALSREKFVTSTHGGGVAWLDLDLVEHRYLLAGAADGSAAAYDMQQPSRGRDSDSGGLAEHGAVFKLERGCPGGHKYSVAAVAWYPIDTGLFVTGSFDHSVKVWDTNRLATAAEFDLGSRVHTLGMSPCAAGHCLVAAGGGAPAVRLCDPASGGTTHALAGHRAAVWALHWSPSCEWHLASGAADGQVRLWDIRTSGCMQTFDQHRTQRDPRRKRSGPGAGLGSDTRAPDQATAHDGAITAVVPTPDGLFWLTAGTDSRVRLWDSLHARNLLVNYPNTHNAARKEAQRLQGRQLAVAGGAGLLFHPSGSVVQALALLQGPQRSLLRGHLATVNACSYNPLLQELYTGSDDCQVVVWAPPRCSAGEEATGTAGNNGVRLDVDQWSE